MFPAQLDNVDCFCWHRNGLLTACSGSQLSLYSLRGPSIVQFGESLDTQRQISAVQTGGPGYEVTATGSSAGAVGLWRTQYLLDRPKQAYMKEDLLFSNPVNALAFCPSKPSLLAAASNEVLILNVEQAMTTRNSDEYTFSPGQTPENAEGSMVASIAWNPKVQHIFAAVSTNGATAIWDLRTTKLLFDVSDPNYYKRVECTGIEWNPEIPTQFVLSYDDDQAPFLQVWDLRYAEKPLKDMRAHTQGITSLSWCPDDSALLMSCDRGGRGVIWNFKTGEQVSDFTTLPSTICSEWVPQHYGLVSFLSQSGQLEVKSIFEPSLDTRETVVRTTASKLRPEAPQAHSYAPKWLSTRGGACFSMNGTLVAFSEKSTNILIRKPILDTADLKQRLAPLKAFASQGEYLQLTEHLAHTAPESERLELSMLAAQLQSKSSSAILEALGFDPAKITKETEKFTGKKKTKLEEKKVKRVDPIASFTSERMSENEVEDFFNSAGQQPKAVNKPESPKQTQAFEFKQTVSETISRNSNWDEGGERLIKENLLINNLESAIDCALACGRTAEALIIAEQGGRDLFERTKQAVLGLSKDLFLRTSFSKLISKDCSVLIQEIPLDKWQEALALCLTHSPDDLERLSDDLGSRLLSERSLDYAASACFILARQFEKVLHLWISRARKQLNRHNRLYVFQELVAKTLALREACKHRTSSDRQDRLVLEFVELLVAEGLLDEAVESVSLGCQLGSLNELQVWMERLSKHRNSASKVKVPWEYFNVKPIKYAEVKQTRSVKTANLFPTSHGAEPSFPTYGNQSHPVRALTRPEERKETPFGFKTETAVAPPVSFSRPLTSPPSSASVPTVLSRSPFPDGVVQRNAPPIATPLSAAVNPPPSQLRGHEPPPVSFRGKDTATRGQDPPPTTLRSHDPPPTTLRSMDTPPTTLRGQDPPKSSAFRGQDPPPSSAFRGQEPPPSSAFREQDSPAYRGQEPPMSFSRTPPLTSQTQHVQHAAYVEATQPTPAYRLPTMPAAQVLPRSVPPPPTIHSREQATIPSVSSYPRTAGPPPSISREASHQELDISAVPGEYRRIAQVWKDALNIPAISSNQRVKRETEGKLQELIDKLAQREFSDATIGVISGMTEAFEASDLKIASNHIVSLTQTAFDSNRNWITAVKRLIQLKGR